MGIGLFELSCEKYPYLIIFFLAIGKISGIAGGLISTMVLTSDKPSLSKKMAIICEEEYDYIVVGSGPAGCAVARSLLENINKSVG